MVSLEEKFIYQNRINESLKLTAFNHLLAEEPVPPHSTTALNESDEIYYAIVNSILRNDKALFESYYNKKNKSNPSEDFSSPFVNDDFLIFCLIVGIIKFGFDKGWIKNIISIRSRNVFTITFENIINENFYSKSNVPEIVLMFFKLFNNSLITNNLLIEAFKSIYNNTMLFESKSDFHIVCSLRAYELIVELKEANSGSQINLLKQFSLKFIARIKVLTWIVQTLILVSILYGTIEIISLKPEVKVLFDKIGSVMKVFGLIGISQLSNVFPFIKQKLMEMMLRIFGYPKALIKLDS